MNESQYIYLQNKKWRAITFNWDILSQNSNVESKLYCLTDFQVAWLLSVTEYFRWSTRWQNCPCTQSDLDAMKAEMEYNLMSCFDFQPYQIQTLYNDSQNALLTRYNDLWNGTEPSSVNPNAPDDYFDGDGSDDREDALCTALSLWTYSYAVDWATKASVVLGLAAVVTEIVNLMIPVGGDIATEVISHLITPTQAELNAMQNVIALDTVICDWKNALEGQAINPTNWTTEIQGLSYTLDSPEDLIQQILGQDTQLLSNFLSFVNSLGKAYEYAQLGVFICACGSIPVENTVVVTFDGSGYANYTVQEGTISGSVGDPLPSGHGTYNAGIATMRTVVRVDLLAEREILEIGMYGRSSITNFTMLVELRDESLNLISSYLDTGNSPANTWIFAGTSGLSVTGIRYVDFYCALGNPSVNIYQDNLLVRYYE